MANAAIPLDPEPYDTVGLDPPMGRHVAGEGFLSAFLRHAQIDRLHLWRITGAPQEVLEPLVTRLGPPRQPINWIAPLDRAELAAAGAVHFPAPMIQREAWARRALGPVAYSLTAVAHSITEMTAMDELAALLIAPFEPWDAIVCTSLAQRRAIEAQLQAVAEHLADRLGASRVQPAQLATIPLGVDVAAFAHDDGARARWRAALELPQDAVVALYVGRFSVETKMRPGPMGLALTQAAERAGRPVVWLLVGAGRTPQDDEAFRGAARAFCGEAGSGVDVRFAGTSDPWRHGPVWSAADIFLSLSDNVQETFGISVLEAMAAGLPVVASDWDGYRDIVRDGEGGRLVRTTTPRAGLGGDLVNRYAVGASTYGGFVGAAAQFTAVDVGEAAQVLAALIADPELRRSMGAAGQARARKLFDWRVVIPQYQELWSELERRRLAAGPQPTHPAGANPWRLDPFRQYAGYPTHALSQDDVVEVATGRPSQALAAVLAARGAADLVARMVPTAEAEAVVARLAADGPMTVAQVLADFPPVRRPSVERGLVWLAKYGVLRINPRSRF